MQRKSIRMYAEAISFHHVKVYLAKNYYNGISSKFYLKDIVSGETVSLAGDAGEEEDGYNTYILHCAYEPGRSYQIMDQYGLVCFLDFSPLSTCKEFDDHFYYDGDDLGSHYSRNMTTFKVWSPLSTKVVLRLYNNRETKYIPMVRMDKGVYGAKVYGDYDSYEYVYQIWMNDTCIETVDPYACASTANQKSSIIIDLDKIDRTDYPLPPLEHKTDAIIYELNVRDFSVNPYGELRHKGKFLAFTENGSKTYAGYSTGVDYLEKLGVTHIQLMPINDYATVDEDHPYDLYNWGYDPAQYNVTEGGYVSDPNDGLRRIIECKQMIKNIHKHHMRVILDVVFNHLYDVNHNSLEKTVPYYFFRRDEEGELTNGTWCGNDMNTTAKMCRKYILDMCRRWQTLYGCDGFRMDLMGIIDIETVNAIEQQGRSIDESFMLYGEGWNMGTLPDDQKAMIANHAKLPNVGFFNDHFRDTMRGNNLMETKGYVSGDTFKTNEAIECLCDYNKFTNISQSINYVECHDNGTVYDKFSISNAGEVESCLERRCTLALAMTIMAQGIPFIHQGQEFFGTKGGNVNSYNAGDNVNQFDWGRRDRYIDHVRLIKYLINLRKENKCFRYTEYEEMREHIHLYNVHHRMVEYQLTQDEGKYHEFRIFFNPSYEKLTVDIDESFKVLYCMENETIKDRRLTVTGVSMVILAR